MICQYGNAIRCVRIEAKDGKATVSATNLEEWIEFKLEAVGIEREGACLANLADLRSFLKDAQPRRCVEIESDGAALKLATAINGNSIAKGIQSGELSEWPVFPKEPAQIVKASPEFMEAIRRAAPSSVGLRLRGQRTGCRHGRTPSCGAAMSESLRRKFSGQAQQDA
jgi:DNA polymerase III sliding clamp (beta) subunit (PCNA family)